MSAVMETEPVTARFWMQIDLGLLLGARRRASTRIQDKSATQVGHGVRQSRSRNFLVPRRVSRSDPISPLLMKLSAPGRFLLLLTKMFAPTDAIWPAARQTAAIDAFLT
jgi:hypothetical protein